VILSRDKNEDVRKEVANALNMSLDEMDNLVKENLIEEVTNDIEEPNNDLQL
jgi:hypothetical protein